MTLSTKDLGLRLVALGEAIQDPHTAIGELQVLAKHCKLNIKFVLEPNEKPDFNDAQPPYMKWAELDPKYQYQAIDYHGVVFAYVDEPYIEDSGDEKCWTAKNITYTQVGDYGEIYRDWKTSLIKRPEGK